MYLVILIFFIEGDISDIPDQKLSECLIHAKTILHAFICNNSFDHHTHGRQILLLFHFIPWKIEYKQVK